MYLKNSIQKIRLTFSNKRKTICDWDQKCNNSKFKHNKLCNLHLRTRHSLVKQLVLIQTLRQCKDQLKASKHKQLELLEINKLLLQLVQVLKVELIMPLAGVRGIRQPKLMHKDKLKVIHQLEVMRMQTKDKSQKEWKTGLNQPRLILNQSIKSWRRMKIIGNKHGISSSIKCKNLTFRVLNKSL